MNHVPPHSLRVAVSVGKVTFLEILRDKILYNIFLFAVLLLGIAFLASRLTFIRPERVTLDFGISAVGISCSSIGILLGSGMLAREFDRRTIWVALSHPISRLQFVFGKFAGLAAALSLNWLLLCLAFLGILSQVAGPDSPVFQPVLFWALGLILLQSWMIASIALLISAFSTTSLAVALSIGFYLIGNNLSQIRFVASKSQNPLVAQGLSALAAILPDLEHFNLGFKVTYGMEVGSKFLGIALIYGVLSTIFYITIAGLLAQRKEA